MLRDMTQPLVSSPAWRALQEHHASTRSLHMRDLFRDDPGRAETARGPPPVFSTIGSLQSL